MNENQINGHQTIIVIMFISNYRFIDLQHGYESEVNYICTYLRQAVIRKKTWCLSSKYMLIMDDNKLKFHHYGRFKNEY